MESTSAASAKRISGISEWTLLFQCQNYAAINRLSIKFDLELSYVTEMQV